MSHVKCSKSGFTLVEMLISITIFMIFIGIAGGSYTSLVSANRSANETQKTYQEVRNVFDTLANEIRGGTLDYSCIDPTDGVICSVNQNAIQKKILGIMNPTGTKRTLFRFDEASKKILVIKQENVFSGGAWQSLTSQDFQVDDFSFDVFPASDPYSSKNTNIDSIQYQPAVTIFLKTKGYTFRDTYSSRTYGQKSLYNKIQ